MNLELEKEDIKSNCSKQLYKNPTTSNAKKKITKNEDVIVIDEDDSCDSAYETGSALSRSSLSSPTGN